MCTLSCVIYTVSPTEQLGHFIISVKVGGGYYGQDVCVGPLQLFRRRFFGFITPRGRHVALITTKLGMEKDLSLHHWGSYHYK